MDDLLPISREGTLMCTFSTNKGELWASIIEKAVKKTHTHALSVRLLIFYEKVHETNGWI